MELGMDPLGDLRARSVSGRRRIRNHCHPMSKKNVQAMLCDCGHLTNQEAGKLVVVCEKCGRTTHNPFFGEMECIICGAKEIANPNHRTDWRSVTIPLGGKRTLDVYGCPKHFPPDGSRSKLFENSYRQLIQAAAKKFGFKYPA
jgi:hypothetical protein